MDRRLNMVQSLYDMYQLKFNYSQYTILQQIEKMDDTHLLKHTKQAILVWSFRQNTFLGSLLQKCSIWSCYAIAVVPSSNLLYIAITIGEL